MSLPACFVAAGEAAGACPLIIVDRASFPAWRDAQPAPTIAWLDANSFVPSAGSFLLVPNAQGALVVPQHVPLALSTDGQTAI